MAAAFALSRAARLSCQNHAQPAAMQSNASELQPSSITSHIRIVAGRMMTHPRTTFPRHDPDECSDLPRFENESNLMHLVFQASDSRVPWAQVTYELPGASVR
jgi:hypothetical protein